MHVTYVMHAMHVVHVVDCGHRNAGGYVVEIDSDQLIRTGGLWRWCAVESCGFGLSGGTSEVAVGQGTLSELASVSEEVWGVPCGARRVRCVEVSACMCASERVSRGSAGTRAGLHRGRPRCSRGNLPARGGGEGGGRVESKVGGAGGGEQEATSWERRRYARIGTASSLADE